MFVTWVARRRNAVPSACDHSTAEDTTQVFFRVPIAIAGMTSDRKETWLREFRQVDKWIFCLTTATLAEDQEIK